MTDKLKPCEKCKKEDDHVRDWPIMFGWIGYKMTCYACFNETPRRLK